MRKNRKRNSSKTLKKHTSYACLQTQPYYNRRQENIYQWGDNRQKPEGEGEKLYTQMLDEFDDNIRVCYRSLASRKKNPSIKRCLLMELIGIQGKEKYLERTKLNPEKSKGEGERSLGKEKSQPHRREKNKKNKKQSRSKENNPRHHPQARSKTKNSNAVITRQISAIKVPLVLSRCNSVNQLNFQPLKTNRQYNNSQKESRCKKVVESKI